MRVKADWSGVERIARAVTIADGYPNPDGLVRVRWWHWWRVPRWHTYAPRCALIIMAVAELERAELEPPV